MRTIFPYSILIHAIRNTQFSGNNSSTIIYTIKPLITAELNIYTTFTLYFKKCLVQWMVKVNAILSLSISKLNFSKKKTLHTPFMTIVDARRRLNTIECNISFLFLHISMNKMSIFPIQPRVCLPTIKLKQQREKKHRQKPELSRHWAPLLLLVLLVIIQCVWRMHSINILFVMFTNTNHFARSSTCSDGRVIYSI